MSEARIKGECYGCEICTNCGMKDGFDATVCDYCGDTIDIHNHRKPYISTEDELDFCDMKCFDNYLASEFVKLADGTSLEQFNELDTEEKADYLGISYR